MNPAESYILNQPEPFRGMLLHIQSVVELTVADLNLKYKYRIPFYYSNGKPFCYLNQSKDYVDLGFWNATHLTKHLEHLVSENRKLMKSLRYRSLEDINDTVLVDILKEAHSLIKN